MSISPEDFERALSDPASVFAGPEAIAADPALGRDQKVALLLAWEYNLSEEAVALEEGMPGEETGLLRRVLIALGAVVGPLDLEHTAPTKQHGLTRLAVPPAKGVAKAK